MPPPKIEDYDGADKVIKPSDYTDALAVQSASNLAGVTHSFGRIVSAVTREASARGKDTEWVNCHPLCILFAIQILHLTQRSITTSESGVPYHKAYDYCEARQTPLPPAQAA
jgi:hypothetical protein